MSTTAQHAMHGLLIVDKYDMSLMTSGARSSSARGYVPTPTFRLIDRTGIVGQRTGSLEVEGYFIKGDLGEAEAILNRAFTIAGDDPVNVLYAPYAPNGATAIGEDCSVLSATQVAITEGADVNGVVMLNQSYIAKSGIRPAKLLSMHAGVPGTDTTVSTDEVQSLVFTSAPEVQEFAVRAVGTTEVFVFTPTTSNATLQAGILALNAYGNCTSVTVSGSLTGTTLRSGTKTVTFDSNADVPQLQVLTSESQNFVVAAGDTGTYTLGGSATFLLGDSTASIQTKVRAVGGRFAGVVLTGNSNAAATADIESFTGVSNPSFSIDGNSGNFSEFASAGVLIIDRGASVALGTVTVTCQGNPMQSQAFVVDASDSATFASGVTAVGTCSAIGANVFNPGFAARYLRLTAPTLGGINVAAVNEVDFDGSIDIDPSADIDIYFPYAEGNVINTASTGTNDTVTTLTIGEDDAAAVIAESTSTQGIGANTYVMRSGAYDGTTVDLGKNFNRGYTVHLHAPYVSGSTPNLVVTIQHSANNTDWVTLVTLDALSAAGTVRATAATGQVNRYVRAKLTGGNITGTWAFTVGFSPYGT